MAQGKVGALGHRHCGQDAEHVGGRRVPGHRPPASVDGHAAGTGIAIQHADCGGGTANRADRYAYRDRRVRKRQYRTLWIQRIGAAARLNGLSYSQLMHGLKANGVEVDRKVLADLAVKDAAAFAQIATQAKAALAAAPAPKSS